jgi:hypothetical protein
MANTTMPVPAIDTTKEEPPAQPAATKLPVRPLLEYLGGDWAARARQRGMHPTEVAALLRSLNRARVAGELTVRAADMLAVRAAGVHPSLIWGVTWWSNATCGGASSCDAADCCEPGDDRDSDDMCR